MGYNDYYSSSYSSGVDLGDFLPYVIGIILFLVFFPKIKSLLGGESETTSTLVLTKFNVDSNKKELLIEGRSSGLIAWAMTHLKLSDRNIFSFDSKGSFLKTSSLSGESEKRVAIGSISSVNCSYRRQIFLLILGILAILITFPAESIFPFMGGVALLVWYYFSKSISISVETSGGKEIGVQFKNSIIENIDVDFPKAKEATEMIASLLLK